MLEQLERTQFGQYRIHDDILDKGGVGSIHRTDDPKYVFKRYMRQEDAPGREAVERLVHIGRGVLFGSGRQIGDGPASSINWPVDFQTDVRGRVTGVVLPAIPRSMFNEYDRVNGLDVLTTDRGHSPLAAERVQLVLQMAQILAFVDRQELVHGDINGKNIAWTTNPQTSAYLIDCDGMVPRHPAPHVGVGARGWIDPRVADGQIPAHDRASDHYALALVVRKGLLLKRELGDVLLPAGVQGLLDRAFSDPLDADARPTPAEWVEALHRGFASGKQWDRLAVSRLPQPFRAGDDQTGTSPGAPRATTVDASRSAAPTPTRQPQGRPPQPSGPPPQPSAPQLAPTAPPPRPLPAAPRPTPRPTPAPPVRQQDQVLPRDPALAGVGIFGRHAVGGSIWWYLGGLLTVWLIPGLCLAYSLLALFQTRKVRSGTRGTARAVVSLFLFMGFASFRCAVSYFG